MEEAMAKGSAGGAAGGLPPAGGMRRGVAGAAGIRWCGWGDDRCRYPLSDCWLLLVFVVVVVVFIRFLCSRGFPVITVPLWCS